MNEILLTHHEAAALTGYAPEYIRKLRHSGKLACVTHGRYHFYRRKDLLRLPPKDVRGRKAKKNALPS